MRIMQRKLNELAIMRLVVLSLFDTTYFVADVTYS